MMNAEAVGKILQAEVKLEVALNSLLDTFHEIGDVKKGLADLVERYGEQYCS